MSIETFYVHQRMALFDLMLQHPDWGLRSYAKALHHSLSWVHQWFKTLLPYQQAYQGPEDYPSMEVFASGSHKTHRCPHRLPAFIARLICQLRPELSEKYNRPAGARTIQAALKHRLPPEWPIPSESAIYKVLHQNGVYPPKAKRVRKPVVLPSPMEEWELDFGEIRFGPGEDKLEFLMVVDRGTSRIVHLVGCAGYDAESALLAVVEMFIVCGMPQRLRFDRDPRLFGSWTRDSYPSPLMCLLRCLGVKDVICPPRRPDLKPFVERTIETLKYEWFQRHNPSNLAEGLDLLPTFVTYYHSERPHQGQACKNQTPDEAFPVLPTLPEIPQWVKPDSWVETIDGRVYQRRVNSNGMIQIDCYQYSLGQAWVGHEVLAKVKAQTREFEVYCGTTLVKTVAMKGVITGRMRLMDFVDVMKDRARSVMIHRMLHWEQQGVPF